ncbi:MAG: 30S ribosomal protein S4 [Candidatus Moranbacteria bacterium]|nr:30S ribosomal protein S4 [Candidatus Moranbacteria bacterium]
MNLGCKKCRRAGEKLLLKGERCSTPKCALIKKNYPPGQHGSKAQRRLTDYGIQLNVKQKIKRTYGISEAQLRNYFKKAKGKSGDTAEQILAALELRFDNVIYRSGLADSRAQARQLVNHGFFKINNRKVDIASYAVKPKQKISIKQNKVKKVTIAEKLKKLKKEQDIPQWLSFDFKKGVLQVINAPQKQEVKSNLDFQMIIEYYSR